MRRATGAEGVGSGAAPHLARFRPTVCRRNRDGRMMSGRTNASLLGERAQVALERALSEFRSGRQHRDLPRMVLT